MDDLYNRKKTRVEWLLGNTCNYKCSYCNEMFRGGDLGFPPDNLILDVTKDIISHYDSLDRDVVFEFIGGEPTLVKTLPEIGERLHNYPTNLVLRTNGSASIDWWIKAKRFLTEVVITVHKEFADIDHIKEVVKILKNKDSHVDLKILFPTTHTEESWIWMKENVSYFREHFKLGDPYLLYSNFGKGSNRYLPYSETQWTEYKELQGYQIKEDNQPIRPQPGFKGFTCYAGIDILVIDSLGDVYRGWCRQGEKIGNIYNMPIIWPNTPILCQKDVCGNGFDNIAKKEKN